MKHLFLTLLLALAATASLADNRAVSGTHAIGNGRVCVYAKDADLTGIFGPTYSSPTLLTATLETPLLALEAATVRQSDVWAISLRGEGGAGRICDFVSPKGNLFVRQFDTGTPLRFRVELLPETRAYRESHLWAEAVPMRRASSAWRISVAEGVPFYSAYASPSAYHALLYTTAWKPHRRTDSSS